MILNELLQNIEYKTHCSLNLNIECLSCSTVENCANSLFVCLRGINTDGHEFCKVAKEQGAVCAVVEEYQNVDIPQILVNNTRKTLGVLAKNFYGKYCDKLNIIGITGTNGKTTTSYIIKSILNSVGRNVGVIGTLGANYNNQNIDCNLTTPDPIILHKLFKDMYLSGVTDVIMEVSAHSIAFSKIEGIKFKVGVFTNLSQDHLDFFKTMERYSQTKESFFDSKYMDLAVINSDDSLGAKIIKNEKLKTLSYGINQPSDVFAIDIVNRIDKSRFVVNIVDNYCEIITSLLGIHNVYNILAAAATCFSLGINTDDIVKGVNDCLAVDGRINIYKCKDFYVVIDFAHTPDGLKNILSTIKQVANKRVIALFGSGGNRDIDKRPKMGAEADSNSDYIVVTSDNPRYENPDLIIKDIVKGIKKTPYICEPDRKKAIILALKMCEKDDVLVICGKGGEKYQDINGIKVPYTDLEVLEQFMEE